jgi:dinuclear metal center YbgI/SA1388 family protein
MPDPIPSLPVSRRALSAWLDDYLQINAFKDPSLNGLQIEGREEINRIAVAVDCTLATIQDAVNAKADFLIVHHGLFWRDPVALTGPIGRRVRTAMEAGLSIYAAHLPLDAHAEVGNNIMMAKALALQDVQPFGEYNGKMIGFKGKLPVPVSLQDLADSIQKTTGEICLVHGGGPAMIQTVGIISGGAAGEIPQASEAGLDAFITGEPSHAHFADPFEYGVNAIFCGHYESETFGVRALAVKLEDTFGLPWQFLHLPTGL